MLHSTLAQKIVFTYNLPIEYELDQGCQNEQRQVEGKTHFKKTCIYFLTRNYKWPKAYTLSDAHTQVRKHTLTWTHAHSFTTQPFTSIQLQNKQQRDFSLTQLHSWLELSYLPVSVNANWNELNKNQDFFCISWVCIVRCPWETSYSHCIACDFKAQHNGT